MRTKTVYMVGSKQFSDPTAAEKYEALIETLKHADARLNNQGKMDPNGGTFRQQTTKGISLFVGDVWLALKKSGDVRLAEMWLDDPKGIVGRALDDTGHAAYSQYCRLRCIDSQNREWGQPYFANNPNPSAVAL